MNSQNKCLITGVKSDKYTLRGDFHFKGYYLRGDARLDNSMANERIMTIIDNEIFIMRSRN